MSYRQTIKEGIIEYSYNDNKRHVYIKCYDKSTGKDVAKAIEDNQSSLCGGYKIKKIREGFGYKDFEVVFNVRAGAEALYDSIRKIKGETSETTDPSPSTSPTGGLTNNITSNFSAGGINTLFIAAGLIILLAVVILVWKRSK